VVTEWFQLTSRVSDDVVVLRRVNDALQIKILIFFRSSAIVMIIPVLECI